MLNSKPLMFSLVMIATAALFVITPAFAEGVDPCNQPTPPAGISNFDSFVQDDAYFNPDADGNFCEPVTVFDFAGRFVITAIATEAANDLKVTWQETPAVEFYTEDCSNWGLFQEINFGDANLLFEDLSTKCDNYNIDPFCPGGTGGNCDLIKICRLTKNSKPLDYLPNPVLLNAGTYIIGLEDCAGDGDFDDLILAVADSMPQVAPEQLASLTPFTQTDPDSGKTCSITIDEELLPFCINGEDDDTCEAITVIGECTATKKLLTNLQFGKKGDEKGVIGLPLREWIGASESPGQFTYCYPSGSCVVFTF